MAEKVPQPNLTSPPPRDDEGGHHHQFPAPPPTYDQSMMLKTNEVLSSPPSAAADGVYPPHVVGQPQIIYVRPVAIPAKEIPDHLIMAILATVFCCLPFGIVGIVRAAECKAQRATGNRELAVKNSKAARKWSLWSIGCGVCLFAAYLIFVYCTPHDRY